jgi:sodium pump decarboxylase gamma subunit
MKKKILALLFIMLMCLFSLTACVETEETVTDTTIVDSLSQSAENLVNQIVAMDDDTLTLYIDEYYGVDGLSPDAGLLSGLESYSSNKEDLGEFVSFDSCSIVYDTSEKTYTAIAELTFEERGCEFKMIVNRQMSEISSMTFNPDFTFGQKMEKAAMNTVTGIATVFVMLMLISIIIYCFKFIHAWEEKKNSKNAAPAAAVAPVAVEEAAQEEETEELSDDLELVAVITAAIAASEGTSADGLVVRSIKRARNSQWKKA